MRQFIPPKKDVMLYRVLFLFFSGLLNFSSYATSTQKIPTHVTILGIENTGLQSAILLAEQGFDVCCFDTDSSKVAHLKKANPHLVEPETGLRLAQALSNKKLVISSTLRKADCFIITTPMTLTANNTVDISRLLDAADRIAECIVPGNLIVIESSIALGTTEKISYRIAQRSGLLPDVEFFVASCAQRALPGRIFKELILNDRVIGSASPQATKLTQNFYGSFVTGKLHTTTAETAEVVKLVENSSRDLQIAYANQIEAICDTAKLDVREVIELANSHPRVTILSPTCGVGGSGMALDPWSLIETFPNDSLLQKTARTINSAKPGVVFQKILTLVSQLKKHHRKPNVLILGVTFKPDVSELSQSPALRITQMLADCSDQLNLLICDPCALVDDLDRLKLPYSDIEALNSNIDQADIIVALVKHKQFLSIEGSRLSNNKSLIDTCGLMHEISKQN
jgi:UDP-N-acetyl-D-mannosaminuronic acid dehydrogenase